MHIGRLYGILVDTTEPCEFIYQDNEWPGITDTCDGMVENLHDA